MKKIIDPQPIIDKLSFRCLTARGVEASLIGEVIDMLHAAPDLGEGTGFVLIDDVHINANQIRSFKWEGGDLCIHYAGQHFFASWPDPDRNLYKELCYRLGVLPTEDPEECV